MPFVFPRTWISAVCHVPHVTLIRNLSMHHPHILWHALRTAPGDTSYYGYSPWILRLADIWNAKCAHCLYTASINQTSENKWLQGRAETLWMKDTIQIQRSTRKEKKNRELCASEKEAEKHNTWVLNKNENLITLLRLWIEHFIPFFVFCSVRQA